MSINLPGNSHRHVILGRTGSGKSVNAAYHLALRNFDVMPWVIVNSKGDKLINSIPGTTELSLDSPVPKKPGLYIIRPIPQHDDDRLENFMWRCWKKERIGIWWDEGYMIPNPSASFNALLTQGRSKNIPMIILSQRPVWLSKFVWSEADFWQVFQLSQDDDIKTVQKTLKMKIGRLPDYESYWYDVKKNYLCQMAPCPSEQEILAIFERRRVDGERPMTLL